MLLVNNVENRQNLTKKIRAVEIFLKSSELKRVENRLDDFKKLDSRLDGQKERQKYQQLNFLDIESFAADEAGIVSGPCPATVFAVEHRMLANSTAPLQPQFFRRRSLHINAEMSANFVLENILRFLKSKTQHFF